MLRKNKSSGKLERRNADGSWTPLADSEAQAAVATVTGGTAEEASDAWAHLDQLFEDPQGNGGAHAAGPVAEGVDADRNLDVSGDAAGGGPGALVESPAGAGPSGDDASADPRGPDLGRGPDAADRGLGEGSLEIGDIPGLTSGDGKAGTGGQQSVLQRLRARRGVPGGGTVVVRTPKKVVVGERAASARGPAVKDSTEHRLARRKQGKGAEQTRFVPKPAPASLADQPKWVRDLFEAHFRSSRTLELRRSMNRMKLSRQDYAIGWMVMLEAARREPSILRLRDGTE